MTARARTFEFAVELSRSGDVTGDRGGTPLPGIEREAWTPEHLVLAGLVRCSLTSLGFHAERSGLTVASSAKAAGLVTRRDSDGRFAFVEITVTADVTVTPEPEAASLTELLRKAERDCFVGASLSISPTYVWTVNGRRQ